MTNIKDYLENFASDIVDARDEAYSQYKDADDAEEEYQRLIEAYTDIAYNNIKDVLMRGLGE